MNMALTQVFGWIVQFKYAIIFPITVFEGPIISVLSGYLVSLKILNFIIAWVVLTAADLVGDSLYYAVGKWRRMDLVRKYGFIVGATPDRIVKFEKKLHAHSGKTLLIFKFTFGVSGIVLIAAGFAKIPFRKFILFNLLGTAPKMLGLMLVGMYFGIFYQKIGLYFDYTAIFTLIGAGVIIFIYALIQKFAVKDMKMDK
jgi:membrane-associated protein